MIFPSIDDLLSRVDSKYSLVIAAAKRARQLRDGGKPTVDLSSNKEVTLALKEISCGHIKYERTKDGIK
ncbi:MAG: DNA-directed RNA polymerase subunit omega [Firmicutes bacterium]|nr:DNA-directed RNA polymerase subunit omega [Bacillota bacterium]